MKTWDLPTYQFLLMMTFLPPKTSLSDLESLWPLFLKAINGTYKPVGEIVEKLMDRVMLTKEEQGLLTVERQIKSYLIEEFSE